MLIDFRNNKERDIKIVRDQADVKINKVPDFIFQGLFTLKQLLNNGHCLTDNCPRHGFVKLFLGAVVVMKKRLVDVGQIGYFLHFRPIHAFLGEDLVRCIEDFLLCGGITFRPTFFCDTYAGIRGK